MIDFRPQIEKDKRRQRLCWLCVVLVAVAGCVAIKREYKMIPAPMLPAQTNVVMIKQMIPPQDVIVEAVVVPVTQKVYTISWTPRGHRFDRYTVDNWDGPFLRYVVEKKVGDGGWQHVAYETQNTYTKVTNNGEQKVLFRVGIQEL